MAWRKHRYKLLQKAFRDFDLDKNGTLSPFELEQAVKHFNFPFPHEHVMQLALECADTDGDGGISYAEFAKALREKDTPDNLMIVGSKTDKELRKEVCAHTIASLRRMHSSCTRLCV